MNYPEWASPRVLAVAEAKASFGDSLRRVEHGGSVVITRHGKQVAALVPVADYEALARLKAAGPRAGLASLAGGWSGSDDFVDAVRSTRRTRPRPAQTRR